MKNLSPLSTLPASSRIAIAERDWKSSKGRGTFSTGLSALDQLLAGEGFAAGAVHEVLDSRGQRTPVFFAALLARAAAAHGGAIVWLDLRHELYPPALAAAGVPLNRLHLLRPRRATEVVSAVAECCRCKGVAATVAELANPSRVEVRRLQLAAEHGGGAGIFIRRTDRATAHYAAATRWRVTPRTGEPSVRRWEVELIHGHGGHVGQAVILEVNRETNHVRAVDAVADRSAAPQAIPASA